MRRGALRQLLGSTGTSSLHASSMNFSISKQLSLPATTWRKGSRGTIRAPRSNEGGQREPTVASIREKSQKPRSVAIKCSCYNEHRSPPWSNPSDANRTLALAKWTNTISSTDSCSPLSAHEHNEAVEQPSQAEEIANLFSRRWVLSTMIMAAAVGATVAGNPSSCAAALSSGVESANQEVRGVVLRTLKGCGLGVAWYPDFVYNAEGGGGLGKSMQLPDGRTSVSFEAGNLYIPSVSFGTTTILGLPLPPGLTIEVVPKILQGYVDQRTGEVELDFLANFNFTAGSLYHAAPLIVNAKLTTESAQGVSRRGQGRRLDSSGNLKLVAVARLAPVEDQFLRTFLGLPTDCLAELSANISFV